MWFAKYIQLSYPARAKLLWKYRLPNADPFAHVWCISCILINLVNTGHFGTNWPGMLFPVARIEYYVTKWPCYVEWGLNSPIFWVCCLFIAVLCIEAQLGNKISDTETINALRTCCLFWYRFYGSHGFVTAGSLSSDSIIMTHFLYITIRWELDLLIEA